MGPQPRPGLRRRLRWAAAVTAVLAAVLAALVGFRVSRPVSAVALHLSVPSSLVIPGNVGDLPWPVHGQGRLDVAGVGTIGQFGGDRPIPIGSVAKVMTAYLLLADHPLSGGEPGPPMTVTAADVTDYLSRIPSHQSLLTVAAGEQLTERQALQALLLPSANNVAEILARWDAGSASAFLDKMNATAARLGLTGSHYTDPSGFTPTTVSTAADQTVLAERALTVPAFADIVAQPTATLPLVGTVHNYNGLLGVDGVFGVKTGSTGDAGGNLVFAAHLPLPQRTVTVVGAVLGQPGADARAELAAAENASHNLLTAAGRIVRTYTLLPAGPVGDAHGADGRSIPVSSLAALQVTGWPGLRVSIAVQPAPLGSSVIAGQHVGALTATTPLGATSAALTADASVPAPSWWRRLTGTW